MKTYQITPFGGGRNYNYSQDHCYVKLSSQNTDGQLCMVEDRLKPGFFLSRHHHKMMTEIFYILEGQVEFIFDDGTLVAGPGNTVTIPPNVWHAARCEAGGKMLTIFQNGRFDEYLERLSVMSEKDFDDAEKMKRVSEEFDIYEDEDI